MLNKDQVGKALGRVSTGLYIVTARHEGKDDAVLASWVSQCAFEPPAITIVLAENRPARHLIEASGAFIVNVLNNDSNGLLKTFCKGPTQPGASVLDNFKIKKGCNDIAILEESVAYLECKVANRVPVGDHVLYVGEIIGGELLKAEDKPYFHTRSNGFSY